MKFSIHIEKFIGKSLTTLIIGCLPLRLSAQSDVVPKQKQLTNANYISAFAPSKGIQAPATFAVSRDSLCYTIQICNMGHEVKDAFFGKNQKIQILPTGDVYRYIFSFYPTLEAARKDLPLVRRIYPAAFIREYKAGKLGTAIDLNMELIR